MVFSVPDDTGEKYAEKGAAHLTREEQACAEAGGIIKRVCMPKIPICIKQYSDAGQPCRDSAECEGECLVRGAFVSAGENAVGVCRTDNIPCGCTQSLKLGVATVVLCQD